MPLLEPNHSSLYKFRPLYYNHSIHDKEANSLPSRKVLAIDLSSHSISPSETYDLAKGLSFYPTSCFNQCLVADAAAFGCQLRWKYHWLNHPQAPLSSSNLPALLNPLNHPVWVYLPSLQLRQATFFFFLFSQTSLYAWWQFAADQSFQVLYKITA